MGKGTKESYWLKESGPNGTELAVPVVKITGASAGPHVAVVAGVHGSEYVGVQSVIKLATSLDAQKVSGVVTCVPVANVPAFYGRAMHVCPVDGLNLAGVFPGNRAGSYTEALAALIWEQVVTGADFVLDMHGGDLEEVLTPYTACAVTGKADVDEASLAMAEAFDAPALMPEVRTSPEPFTQGGLYDCAAYHGIPAILAEAGSHGHLDYTLLEQNHYHGLINVLRHAGVLDGEVVRLRTPVRLSEFVGVQYPQDGVFYPVVEAGQTVFAGQRVGQLRDLFGATIADMSAPCDALVLGVITTPPMPANSMMLGLGKLA
jgi:uncharacterized protein